MKKNRFIFNCLAIIAAASFIFASVYKKPKAESPDSEITSGETSSIDISLTEIAEVILNTQKQHTDAPDQTTQRQTEKESQTEDPYSEIPTAKKNGKYECFKNYAFIGNSRTLDLKDFGLVDNVYAFVGANVNSVYKKCAPGHSVPIMDEIGKVHYEGYFLQFGENECGWPSGSTFVARYARIINDIKEKDPGAKIYLQSIIPISKSESDKAVYDMTNENINRINSLIKQLAKDEDVEFIDVAVRFRDFRGNLPDDAAYDGVHLKKNSCEKWLDYLAYKIMLAVK